MSFTIKFNFNEHEIGKDFYYSKKDLFNSFFGDFYDFIKNNNGKNDLLKYNIKNRKDFFDFCDWYADGKENCYGMGFAFHKYFLTPVENGRIENQPVDTFIGYCYQNNKYIDFLSFLITFFAWWRNDEHCTCFDPYNHADDFFNSSWAVLVDTCKLFYFSTETVFHWQSYRVKYAIDNIPGVILSDAKFLKRKKFNKVLKLPKLRIAGYEFKGWYDNDNQISEVNKDCTLEARFIRKDYYDYWGKEEKTIKKVYDPNYKKVDPA